MRRSCRLVIVCAALAAFAIASEVAAPRLGLPGLSLVQQAEARVGRPLTPVSVAGVGRRTVRRCAAGVYYC
jgi:hypothetical protein